MVVEGIRASSDPRFRYEYYGNAGLNLDPMPAIGAEPWYASLLKATGNFQFGLTELKPILSTALRKLADEYVSKARKPKRREAKRSRPKRRKRRR